VALSHDRDSWPLFHMLAYACLLFAGGNVSEDGFSFVENADGKEVRESEGVAMEMGVSCVYV